MINKKPLFFFQELLDEILTWITIVGCTLSVFSLVICLYIFTFVKGLRGERTTIHRNLCLCLLLAEILLLAGLVRGKKELKVFLVRKHI